MPEVFRASRQGCSRRAVTPLRTSPRLRGYDARWDRLSAAFRRRFPFCRFCEQDGTTIVFCDVVDHIVPVIDRPDLLHDEANLQALCTSHHSGTKAWLEAEARALGDVNLLVAWCADPNSRPRRRGEVHHGGQEAQDR